MAQILPLTRWTKKDKKLLKRLKQHKITPEEAYEISWAIFSRYNRVKDALKDMECPRCFMKNNNLSRIKFKEELKRTKAKFNKLQKIESFFCPYHNRLGGKLW
jgi:hypothetical protein